MPSNNRNRLTPARLEVMEKEQRAVELRLAGVSFEKIAQQLGWECGSSAHKAVKRAMRERVQEPSEELRRIEVARLDRMIAALWTQALGGKWLAIDRVLKCQERKAALLGLDAPVRRIVDVVNHDAFAEAMQRLSEEVKELEAGDDEDVDLPDYDAEAESEVITDAEVVASATTAEGSADAAEGDHEG